MVIIQEKTKSKYLIVLLVIFLYARGERAKNRRQYRLFDSTLEELPLLFYTL